MLIPTLLTGFAISYVRERLYHYHTMRDPVKHRLGVAYNVLQPELRAPSIDDSMQLSQSLTTVFGKLAKYDQHCRHLLELLHTLEDASIPYCDVTVSEPYKAAAEDAATWIQPLILHMTCSTQSSKDWAEFLERRSQGHFQTLSHFIAQRHSSVSMQLTESSLRIAEATRADNLAMKAIAEHSRIIAEELKVLAVESLRKNNSMRSIAVVTMLFLPATIIATLFSTTFFNFQASDGPTVSNWIWLYFVITAILTLVIQGTWFCSVRRDRPISKSTVLEGEELHERSVASNVLGLVL